MGFVDVSVSSHTGEEGSETMRRLLTVLVSSVVLALLAVVLFGRDFHLWQEERKFQKKMDMVIATVATMSDMKKLERNYELSSFLEYCSKCRAYPGFQDALRALLERSLREHGFQRVSYEKLGFEEKTFEQAVKPVRNKLSPEDLIETLEIMRGLYWERRTWGGDTRPNARHFDKHVSYVFSRVRDDQELLVSLLAFWGTTGQNRERILSVLDDRAKSGTISSSEPHDGPFRDDLLRGRIWRAVWREGWTAPSALGRAYRSLLVWVINLKRKDLFPNLVTHGLVSDASDDLLVYAAEKGVRHVREVLPEVCGRYDDRKLWGPGSKASKAHKGYLAACRQ